MGSGLATASVTQKLAINNLCAQRFRFVIIGLNSNSGDGSFTLEVRYATESEVLADLVLIAPFWSDDHDLESTRLTAELPLSSLRLSQLCTAIESWLETDVSNAGLLDGTYHLAASSDFVFDFSFGKRGDLIASVEKPVVTLEYKLGMLCGEFKFVTDQSCLGEFAKQFRQLVPSIAD